MKRIALIVVACAACGSDANVEGDYMVSLTNRDDGCMIGWVVGNQATNIPVVITQGTDVTASVNGVAGALLDGLLGSHFYTGNVDGDNVSLTVIGDRGQTKGNCAFTFNSTIAAKASGDTLNGRIEYRAVTNGNPDCTALEGCLSFEDFAGVRPPPP
jgi:hypothetical protein